MNLIMIEEKFAVVGNTCTQHTQFPSNVANALTVKRTHLLSGKQRVTLEFACLDDHGVAHCLRSSTKGSTTIWL